jgi:exosortase
MADLPVDTAVIEPESTKQRFDWSAVVHSPAFWPGVALAIGFFLLYFRLFANLWSLWMADDGYYSHGLLVPPICGYIVYRNWSRMKYTPVKPAYIALIPLIALSWVAYRAGTVGISLIMSICLIGSLLCAEAFVAGWRWMAKLAPATLYSAFAMPFWNAAIDAYTNPLQKLSSKVAFQILRLTNHDPYMSRNDDTTILLNHFTLNIAVPCSGLKLLLALAAFVVFFVLVARLRPWASIVMLVSILPMALLFNGLRIAMIGIVGDAYGQAAGMAFHDYSGFITLIICFFALFEFAKALGWKD